MYQPSQPNPSEFMNLGVPKPTQPSYPGAVPHQQGYQGTAPTTAPPINSLISIFAGTSPFSQHPAPGIPGGSPGPTVTPHPPPQIPGGSPGPTGGSFQAGPERYRQYQMMQQGTPGQYQGMLPNLPGWAGYLQWLRAMGGR